VSLFGKEVTLSGNIVSTHDAAGGGYGIQTQKGVYGLCYSWGNDKIVNQLDKLEQSGQVVELSGNETDKWSIDCNSIKFVNDISNDEEILEVNLQEVQNPLGRTLPPVPIVYITSITDQITIKDVTVNRGNCQGTSYAKSKLPKVLKYGQQADFGLMAGCKVKEIKVITNMGERTFNVQ
jgi:hypothetical protein